MGCTDTPPRITGRVFGGRFALEVRGERDVPEQAGGVQGGAWLHVRVQEGVRGQSPTAARTFGKLESDNLESRHLV